MHRIFFPNVQHFALGIGDQWPSTAQQTLSTILDLSRVIKLSLSADFYPEYTSNAIAEIKSLLNQTSNLRSLALYDYWTPQNSSQRLQTICSFVGPHIKHLQIRVKDLNDIKYILERLEHLTSATFKYAPMLTINRAEFLQSLEYLNRYSSMWNCQNSIYIWFGDKKIVRNK